MNVTDCFQAAVRVDSAGQLWVDQLRIVVGDAIEVYSLLSDETFPGIVTIIDSQEVGKGFIQRSACLCLFQQYVVGNISFSITVQKLFHFRPSVLCTDYSSNWTRSTIFIPINVTSSWSSDTKTTSRTGSKRPPNCRSEHLSPLKNKKVNCIREIWQHGSFRDLGFYSYLIVLLSVVLCFRFSGYVNHSRILYIIEINCNFCSVVKVVRLKFIHRSTWLESLCWILCTFNRRLNEQIIRWLTFTATKL